MSETPDVLGIVGFWSSEHKQNRFGIRGTGPRADRLYAWLNNEDHTAYTTSNDWPWHYIAFHDPFYEFMFTRLWEDDIHFEDEEEFAYHPLPEDLKPMGWVPHDQRIPGEKYLETCGHYHTWTPRTESIEDEMLRVMSDQIAREIDAEILDELLALSKKAK